ncbi:MAG: CbiX/SirB N-terminal domain-containing protein [Chthoniobacterales bacterium]
MREQSALLIVGHGSTVNPQSSEPTWAHAAEIRRRGLFAEVECAFWKEEPSLRDALFFFRSEAIEDVYVVPNFISEGYFTQTVIPRELQLSGRATEGEGGQTWKYCEPVGNNPRVTELLLARADEIARSVPRAETTLLIVGHGTELNDNSAVAAKREVEKIRRCADFGAVLNVYMEETPLVADWAKLTRTPNVVVVPFFISDGLHSYEDIPKLLGIGAAPAEVFNANPHRLHGRSLYYARAIGSEAQFADLIVDQVAAFDRADEVVHSPAQIFRAKV